MERPSHFRDWRTSAPESSGRTERICHVQKRHWICLGLQRKFRVPSVTPPPSNIDNPDDCGSPPPQHANPRDRVHRARQYPQPPSAALLPRLRPGRTSIGAQSRATNPRSQITTSPRTPHQEDPRDAAGGVPERVVHQHLHQPPGRGRGCAPLGRVRL